MYTITPIFYQNYMYSTLCNIGLNSLIPIIIISWKKEPGLHCLCMNKVPLATYSIIITKGSCCVKCCFPCIWHFILYYAIFLCPMVQVDLLTWFGHYGATLGLWCSFVHILYRPLYNSLSRYLMRFYHVPFFTAARPRPLGVVLEGG